MSVLAIKLFTSLHSPQIMSKSAIVLDMMNDEILFEKNADQSYPTASMSKLMTIYIVLDLIERGTIHWSDGVVMSDSANDIVHDAVSIPVYAGNVLTVRDLFHAMVIPSANNATIALAEYISGSEAEFTQLMNEKAAELGLSEGTQFFNATGLPHLEMENKMSARDIALLAKHLIEDHPDFLNITRLEHHYIADYDIDLFSTNKMLSSFNDDLFLEEVDGLKTGFTPSAGYCFVSTAEKGDQRLISVIMNAQTDEQRFKETKQLLSFGFNEFTRPPVIQFLKEKARKYIN